MKKRIVFKLFLYQFVLFAAIFLIQLIFQSIYLEISYAKTQRQNILDDVHTIESKIINHEQTDAIEAYITQSSQKNNTIISIMDRNFQHAYGSPLYKNGSYFVLKTKDNREYQIDDTIFNDDEHSPNPVNLSFNKTSSQLLLVEHMKETDLIVLAVSPLQSINEVVGNLNGYYMILSVFTMIIVTLVAFIYSRTLSKPLIKMSVIANQIANQNFDAKYVVKSSDELGQMGEALNKISTNLEQKITELVHANEKLAQDYDIQMKLKKQEKEFVANVSHELKTPLTVINGYVNGIKNGVYQDHASNYYEVILKEVDRMTEMIQEMLDISRLESPTYKIAESTFDLWHIFLKVYDKLKVMAEENGLKVNYKIEDEAYVSGDANRIEQVVTNLLMNAIKYTPKHSQINIAIAYNDRSGKYLFKIENENAHISSDEVERIWDAFYRVEKSRSKEFGGTGLGLAIVKQILDLHQSGYGVHNTQNGVEFYFDLNAVTVDDI